MSHSMPVPHGAEATQHRAAGPRIQPRIPGERVEGWLRNSAISGCLATIALSTVVAIAYWFARAAGAANGNQLDRWLWALVHNPVVQSTEDQITLALALNIAAGLVFAMIYGRFAEPLLPGKDWQKGVLFSLIPFVLSITVFFPVMDGGFLGTDIHAGPLPILGNLIAHLAYGVVLGWIYGLEFASGIDDSPLDHAANEGAERGAAVGVPLGGVVGALVGWLVSPTVNDLSNLFLTLVVGALVGGSIGLLIGSLMGMGDLGDEEDWQET